MQDTAVGFRISKELKQKLLEAATEEKRTLSSLCKKLLEERLNEIQTDAIE